MNIYQGKISDGSTTVWRVTAAGSPHVAVSRLVETAKRVNKLNLNGKFTLEVEVLHKDMDWKTFHGSGKYDEWLRTPVW